MKTRWIKNYGSKLTLANVKASRTTYLFAMKRLEELYKSLTSPEKIKEIKEYIKERRPS